MTEPSISNFSALSNQATGSISGDMPKTSPGHPYVPGAQNAQSPQYGQQPLAQNVQPPAQNAQPPAQFSAEDTFDAMRMIEAWMTMQPYRKTTYLFGGKLKCTFRTLTTVEDRAIQDLMRREVQDQRIASTIQSTLARIGQLRQIMSIAEVKWMPATLLYESYNPVTYNEREHYETHTHPVRQVEEAVASRITSLDVYTSILVAAGDFIARVGEISKIAGDPDFSKKTQTPSG